jgi:O-antigen/teichoic acid export membrane protein
VTGVKGQSGKASIATHYLRYLNANLFLALAGFISFPVMTRKLELREYGIFGYYETLILIITAILKLGFQESIKRFFPEICRDRPESDRFRFYASLLLAPFGLSLVLSLVIISAVFILHQIFPFEHFQYLIIVLILGEVAVMTSLVENTMRAREFSGLLSMVKVISRYFQVGLIIFIIYYVSATAMGVYAARIITEVFALVWLLAWAWRHCDIRIRSFDSGLFGQGVAFGVPLVFSEISMILLAFVDLLMLRYFLGSFDSVGIYKIGYSLAMYISLFLQTSLYAAFVPVANRIYESEGVGPLLLLKQSMVRALTYICLAVIFGLFIVGGDLLVLISGQAHVASIPIFKWIGLNYALQPLFMVLAYGLILRKKTKIISYIVIIATLVNILLNLLLIPRYGIMGSVWATLISYGLMSGLQIIMCPADLKSSSGMSVLLVPVILFLPMVGIVIGTDLFGLDHPAARLFVMGLLTVALYFIPAWYIDARLRQGIRSLLGQT